ncbi:DUF58 domain-containing protein [Caminibacter pacificus]
MIKTVTLKAKQKVFGNFAGRHTSPFKGIGLDFKELREYQYNEDAKRIDWKRSAKFQKPLIKEFEEERELNVIITILVDGSLYFGTKTLKTETIAEIAAILGYSAVLFDDKVSLLLYEKKPITHLKPTKSQKNIPIFVEKILEYEYLKKEYDFSFIDYLNKFQKSLLFLIGDFYKHPPLHKLKHETYVLWVRDKFEENPSTLGEIELLDPHTLKNVTTNLNKSQIEKYKKDILQNDKKFEEFLLKEKIKYKKIYTHEDSFMKLMELMR